MREPRKADWRLMSANSGRRQRPASVVRWLAGGDEQPQQLPSSSRRTLPTSLSLRRLLRTPHSPPVGHRRSDQRVRHRNAKTLRRRCADQTIAPGGRPTPSLRPLSGQHHKTGRPLTVLIVRRSTLVPKPGDVQVAFKFRVRHNDWANAPAKAVTRSERLGTQCYPPTRVRKSATEAELFPCGVFSTPGTTISFRSLVSLAL